MNPVESISGRHLSRQSIIEAIEALALLLLGFLAIGASDVSTASTRGYWAMLVAVFAIAAFVSDRMHTDHGIADLSSATTIFLHWLGVFLAIQLVYYFVASGRMANLDTGLANGLVLALGTFLFGAHGNWRFMVVGLALAAATAGVAFVQEYIWMLFTIAAVAVLLIFFGARLVKRYSGTSTS